MKKEIHPEIHELVIRCVCGNTFQTTSTEKELSVDICAACHPFYTGAQKFVDTAGRIERFQMRYDTTKSAVKKEAAAKPKKEKVAQPEKVEKVAQPEQAAKSEKKAASKKK